MGNDEDPLEIDGESNDWLLTIQSRRGAPANRLSEDQVRRLRNAIEPFLGTSFPAEGQWRKMSDDDLWLQVICQVAGLRGASGGGLLLHDEAVRSRLAWDRLAGLDDDEALVSLSTALRKVGLQPMEADGAEDSRLNALVYNLRVLEGVGGPRKYFRALARKKTDLERVSTLCLELMSVESKSARDLLIQIGMARDFISFDSRIKKILEALGLEAVGLDDKDRFRALEEMFLAAFPSLGVTCLGHLDRVLFDNTEAILSRLAIGAPPVGTISITLGEEVRAELDRLADERGVAPRDLARQLLEAVLGALRR